MDGLTITPHTHRGDTGEDVGGCGVWAESSSYVLFSVGLPPCKQLGDFIFIFEFSLFLLVVSHIV